MSEILDIGMGKLHIATSPTILTTSGIGSCVAVCLFSQIDKKGGLAHIMLPYRTETTFEITDADYKYADIAITEMLKELDRINVQRHGIVAKIVGGANMFPQVQGRSQKVGERNVEAVKEILLNNNVKISAEETGGTTGRALSFDLSNGVVTIKMTI